ncbi:MAG: NAD(P)/FAD-dependent oxidoreductase [Scytonema sp. CRU_2_7]|nr:NAD(P)/FAD-dependent oxidoreductase [Scytonema sp. CRU_2_7]
MLYAHSVVSNLQEQNSLVVLAALGVDVIVGNGQFQSSPHLSFVVNNRVLRARTYLLAMGSRPVIPEIEGLQRTGFLTIPQIWQSLSNSTPPKQWVILGGVPQSIELAQTLARCGYDVTLVVEHRNLLPNIDSEIAQLLCSVLEAEGVRVFLKTLITQVRKIEEKKWLQVGDKAIETDEIVVAMAQQPNIESLNLAAVDVKWNQRRLLVNDKLQTTNPRIWACGDVIGGFEFANIANYEARIALQNALFFPRLKVNYRHIPWAVFTNPMFAQVGLTEAQAKRQYSPDEVIVLRQFFKTLFAAQIQDETTGICKLIVLRDGKILGASVLGTQAIELIHVIALAIAQTIKVYCLAHLAPLYPSFSEIFEQIVRDWKQQKLNSNIAWQDFLESFFHFRRNWNL